MYFKCLDTLFTIMKQKKMKEMTATEYKKERLRLSNLNPEKYSRVTDKEILAIRALLSRSNPNLKLLFERDKSSGLCTQKYVMIN